MSRIYLLRFSSRNFSGLTHTNNSYKSYHHFWSIHSLTIIPPQAAFDDLPPLHLRWLTWRTWWKALSTTTSSHCSTTAASTLRTKESFWPEDFQTKSGPIPLSQFSLLLWSPLQPYNPTPSLCRLQEKELLKASWRKEPDKRSRHRNSLSSTYRIVWRWLKWC